MHAPAPTQLMRPCDQLLKFGCRHEHALDDPRRLSGRRPHHEVIPITHHVAGRVRPSTEIRLGTPCVHNPPTNPLLRKEVIAVS